MHGGRALIQDAAIMPSMGMRALLAAVAIVSASPALAAQIIRCTAPGRVNVDLALNAERKIGHTVSCIYGGLALDIEPCAPAGGGYGQSSDMGIATLVEIATDKAGFRRLTGPVVGHTISPTELSFTAWYKSDNLKPLWSFVLDRSTGKAVLRLEEYLPDPASHELIGLTEPLELSYACRTVRRKF
jgi:hypothetical protein